METAQDFAARYWGGPGVTPLRSPRSRGRRDVDGGAPVIPAGWTFIADGFRYHVYANLDGGYVMEANDGSCVSFDLEGHDWVLDGYAGVRRVPAEEG